MKMPGNNSSEINAMYEFEDSPLSLANDEMDNNGVEDYNNPPENDFSEYLWMENEEEFDKEVMQRLEEEALMEECMEAFMNDDSTQPPTNSAQPPVEAVENSKLNPEAAEFVPLSCRVSLQEPPTAKPASS